MSKVPAPGEEFVTILPSNVASMPPTFLVVLMRPQGPSVNDEYTATRTSQRLKIEAAEALAKSWAAARGITVVR